MTLWYKEAIQLKRKGKFMFDYSDYLLSLVNLLFTIGIFCLLYNIHTAIKGKTINFNLGISPSSSEDEPKLEPNKKWIKRPCKYSRGS